MSAYLPVLSVLFAVLATSVPWGLPADATFILPLTMVMMVFCWRAMPDVSFSTTSALLLGLLTDVLSGGPLGFWALLALIAAGIGSRARDVERSLSTLWFIWTVLAAALGLFGWLLASLYFFRWIDAWPIAFGVLASIALFPVVLHGLLWIKRGRFAPLRATIYRGRA